MKTLATRASDQTVIVFAKKVSILSALFIVLTALFSSIAYADEFESLRVRIDKRNLLQFDVAESGPKFSFDEAPLIGEGPNAGLPAYGNAFVTQGYIYPINTLTDSDGVNPDGSPEFPELVIGEWTCRGYFIGDGVNTETGPWVITTQHYDFYSEPGYAPNKQSGALNLVTDGYEIVDIGVPGKRSITGGTGFFSRAHGEAQQTLLGFNQSEGVKLRFKIRLR